MDRENFYCPLWGKGALYHPWNGMAHELYMIISYRRLLPIKIDDRSSWYITLLSALSLTRSPYKFFWWRVWLGITETTVACSGWFVNLVSIVYIDSTVSSAIQTVWVNLFIGLLCGTFRVDFTVNVWKITAAGRWRWGRIVVFLTCRHNGHQIECKTHSLSRCVKIDVGEYKITWIHVYMLIG
jgi:hypothetical protein